MSKLLGLNPSNVLETIKSKDNALFVSSSSNIVTLPAYEVSLDNGDFTAEFDLRGARKVRIYGNSTVANFLQVQFSLVGGVADWKFIDQINPLTINGSICINYHLDTPPPYLRIANTSAVTHGLSLRIVLEK